MYRACNHIRTSYQQDGAIVLDVIRGKIYGLNPVGSRMLRLLEAGRDGPSIVSEISRDFEMNQDLVRQDLQQFVDNLIQQQLLEPASGDGQ
jgi:hypothetical protein